MITRELPTYAEWFRGTDAVDIVAALQDMYADPPVLRIELADLQREVSKIRGVYGCSYPTIDTELALKMGRCACQWLTRDPDWQRAHFPDTPIYLYELTPVLVEKGSKQVYKNAVWRIEVIGEVEDKVRVRLGQDVDRALIERFAAAG